MRRHFERTTSFRHFALYEPNQDVIGSPEAYHHANTRYSALLDGKEPTSRMTSAESLNEDSQWAKQDLQVCSSVTLSLRRKTCKDECLSEQSQRRARFRSICFPSTKTFCWQLVALETHHQHHNGIPQAKQLSHDSATELSGA